MEPTKKMTIHRALAELKLIDSKIEKQIMELAPNAVYQKDKLIGGYTKLEDFASTAQSKFQSVTDLIENKMALKSAIVAANGVTTVTIGGKIMTIADAINFKKIIGFKQLLIRRIKAVHQTAVAELNRNNTAVGNNMQKLLEFTFGKENVKASKDDMDAVMLPYITANEYHFFDPLKVAEIVEAMEKEVSAFEAEVDAVLSEINAVTFINIG